MLVAGADSLYADFADRPGRSKLEKEAAARPRQAMHLVFDRLTRDAQRGRGPAHLRADVLEEPLHSRRLFAPESLSVLLVHAGQIVRVPPASGFAAAQPRGYIASFVFDRVGWALLAGYAEIGPRPVLVFLRAMELGQMAQHLGRLAASAAAFDGIYAEALGLAGRLA